MSIGKAIRWLLALAAIAVVAWSFGQVGLRYWQSHDPTDHRITLTILHWGDDSEIKIVSDMVASYEQSHPNIKIIRIHAPDYDSKIKTMLAAGTPPDLFYLGFQYVHEFCNDHLLANLDPFIAKLPDGKQWLNGFYPILLDAYRYDGATVGVGPLYGIPKDFSTLVMYVNCDLFAKAHIPVPYGGWTWEEFAADCKKISDLSTPGDPTGRTYGAVVDAWPQMIQNIVESFGGGVFNGSNFRDVLIDSPPSLYGLDMLHHMRFDDDSALIAVEPATINTAGQLFFTGKIGIIGPVGRWATPHYRGTGPGDPGISAFHWDIVPQPHKGTPVNDLAVVAWTMSSQCKHPAEAFDLLHFLCGPQGQKMTAQLGLAIPSLKKVAQSDDFLAGKPDHAQLFLDAIKYGRISQIPVEREFTQYLGDEMAKSLEFNLQSPTDAAKHMKALWLNQLDSPLLRKNYPLMDWRAVGTVATGAVLVAAFLLWIATGRQKLGHLDRKMQRIGYLFVSPWLIGFVALTLGPMILSLLLSLTRWTALEPMGQARFVGLDNYQQLLAFDQETYPSLRVTAYYALLMVPLGQLAALMVALLMNANVKVIDTFRTIYYIPTLVSGVTLATMWLWMFSPDYGPVNQFLRPILHVFGTSPPDWLGRDAPRWAVPAFVVISLWTIGGGMLTYLAALKNVPVSLYEAARIDGAGPLHQFFNVTLPMISPLIFFNLIMAIIASFQIFVQVYVMTDGGPGDATLFFVLYLYRQAFEFHNMGYASAMAWVLFLLVLGLTGLVIRSGRKWVYYEGLKA